MERVKLSCLGKRINGEYVFIDSINSPQIINEIAFKEEVKNLSSELEWNKFVINQDSFGFAKHLISGIYILNIYVERRLI